jgi:hypothetical protein
VNAILMGTYRARWAVILVLLAAGLGTVFLDAPSPVRAAVVLPIFLLCPGLAIGGAIGFDGPASVLRLTVPISLAVSVLIAQILLTTHTFEPKLGLLLVCGICAAAVLGDWLRGRRA